MNVTGNLTITTPSDTELEIHRQFNAPARFVFDAYTKPELIRRWMLGPPGWTMPVCEVDLRVDGRFRYEWRNAEGAVMAMSGVFQEIDPPNRLVSTERFDEDWTGGDTVTMIVFSESEGKTAMSQTIRYSSKEARDGALRSGMAEGMEAGFVRLDEIVSA